ncbi:hypothetical protein EMPS_06562 [Entomortierella parvispora]|uniref:F-box domain-containing protein n=1 Tax=Entomortierella parvispora TaxID=205924 RepID=A0A9P3HCL3_9FUNG|nr:hypothetical protein EMPS_06562 [Entomortierella parvispora]
MDIPEIRAEVGLYLRGGNEKPNFLALTQCARVCKAWRDTFIPLLYRTIDTNHFSVDTPGMSKLISLALGLQRHGRHLTRLSLGLPFPYLDVFTTSTGNIKRLSIVQDENTETNKDALGDQHKLRTLLNNNPGIEYLYISLAHDLELSRTVGQIIQHCLQLKELEVEGGVFDLADLIYINGLSRLSKVCISESDIKVTGEHLLRTPTLPSLRHFGLSEVRNETIAAAIEMISNWPHLESLTFSVEFNPSSKRRIFFPQPQNALRMFQPSAQISKLSLQGMKLTDQDLARVLDGCPALSNLEIADMDNGETSFGSLLKLAGSLTSLELSCEGLSRYWTPQRLLCSLPNLELFSCDVMDVDELYFGATLEEELLLTEKWQRHMRRSYPGLEDEPKTGPAEGHSRGRWICKGLQTLKMESLTLSLDNDRNKAFMDQLGGLQELDEFYALNSRRQVIVTEASAYYSNTASRFVENNVSDEPVQMLVHDSDRSLSRYDLMQDPSKQWILTLWPWIQCYMGPCQPFTSKQDELAVI